MVASPPPLPGGHELGDQLYYAGSNQTFESGDKLVHGQQGEVVGPATEGTHQGNGLKMQLYEFLMCEVRVTFIAMVRPSTTLITILVHRSG